jgi:hypothetical protein
MIQIIGIMIAFYIFARLAEMLDDKKLGTATRIFACISAVVTVFFFNWFA